jgi:hypothetical protein
MEKTIKKIGFIYYLVYTTTILATMVGYLLTMNSTNHIDSKSTMGIALTSIVILYILLSIPLSLGGFHKMTKKWMLIEDENMKLKTYEKGAIIRLLLIGIGLVGSIIVFFLLRTDVSLIYCAAISAFALLFCKPSQGKIISELKLEEE